jgi:hypothetical protein
LFPACRQAGTVELGRLKLMKSYFIISTYIIYNKSKHN